MTSSQIRQKFLDFFEARGHAILPSASLVPENDPSVLFNTAGMQPLVPYLMGQKHPSGNRLASCQKCVRTGDLDDIGDNRHFSFFEMLGNWSLGDYFKKEAIAWSYEFLISNKEEGLGLEKERLYVTVFEGDENAPRDTESLEIWKSLGIPENRIYFLGADDNWWSPGDNGPCGPDSEMFYDMTDGGLGNLSKEEFLQAQEREDIIEIWNDVFMEYEKKDGRVIGKLAQQNVDTGAGLERLTAVMQGKKTAYETDIFTDVIEILKNYSHKSDDSSMRIVSDHIRTATFMVGDGVVPDSKDRGYVLRKLIRRATMSFRRLNSHDSFILVFDLLVKVFVDKYENEYNNLNYESIVKVIREEIIKFEETIQKGKIEAEKVFNKFMQNINKSPLEAHFVKTGQNIPISKPFISARDVFPLYETHGIPKDLILELIKEKNFIILDQQKFDQEFDELFIKHQNLSRAGAEQKFKGGLADHSDATVKLHTAHHLLLAALQKHVSPDIHQRGSNITAERLRMDFNFERKLTDEEKKKVEDQVNEWIEQKLPVERREMARSEAEALGAEMEFGAKYPDVVSVYVIEAPDHTFISKEFCGGPHITNTGELGHFVLQKEEASSAGVRRVKGIFAV